MTRIPRGARSFQWRRQRQQKARRWPTLNLVALMDVFTILVFFFLVHSANPETGPVSKLLSLPESRAAQRPRETLVVMITADSILVQGDTVVASRKALTAPGHRIDALEKVLRQKAGEAPGTAEGLVREVTIMGDRNTPFRLLNKVMLSCTRAGFGRISLSVLQKSLRQG